MHTEQVKTRMVVTYDGHSVRKDGDIDVKFKADYGEVVNVLSLFQMLNQNVDIKVKVGSAKPSVLGTFIIRSISVDRDGESKLKFNSEANHVNLSSIMELAVPDTLITLQATATIEVDD